MRLDEVKTENKELPIIPVTPQPIKKKFFPEEKEPNSVSPKGDSDFIATIRPKFKRLVKKA